MTAQQATVPAGRITTIAGGVGGPGPGPSVSLNGPCGVTFGHGMTYFTEAVVRQLDPGTGMLKTLVGPANTGLDPVGRAAPAHPCGAAVDGAGNLAFADTGNNVVRVAAARTGTFYGVKMRAGRVYIVAGRVSAHGTPATQAVLRLPYAVVVDRHGNLLVSSQTAMFGAGGAVAGSAIVQGVGGATGTVYGQRMVPGGLYIIAAGHCASSYCSPGFAGDGGPAAAALFGANLPQMAVDAAGNVVMADSGNNRVRVISASSRTFYGQKMTAGDLYTIAGGGTGLGNGAPATHATLNSPQGVAIAADGNVVVSDSGNQRIRLVAAANGRFYGQAVTSGDIYTIAGNGSAGFAGDKGPAVRAELRSPAGVAIDGKGNVIFADALNNRVRLVAAKSGLLYGQRMTVGHIYTIAGNWQPAFSGDGGLATRAQLNPFSPVVSNGFGGNPADPGNLAVSHSGNIIIADSVNNRVRVIAEANGRFYGRKFTAGHIYTVAGTAGRGSAGDGGPGNAAHLTGPIGVAADAVGNIVVSDGGDPQRVRVIAVRSGRFYGRAMTAGHIYTVAGGGSSHSDGVPATQADLSALGLAVDGSGNILIAAGPVRVVAAKSGRFYGQKMTAGDIYTITGGDLLAVAVAVDHAGNLVIADYGASEVVVYAVRTARFYGRQMTAGHTYTVAGVDDVSGFTGDGGPATKAKLSSPAAVAVDSAGNLLIADDVNNRIRMVAERTGNFYGRKRIAGDIYRVAGGGSVSSEGSGFSGDGGPAVNAILANPCGVAPFGTGLVVLDEGNARVREVSG